MWPGEVMCLGGLSVWKIRGERSKSMQNKKKSPADPPPIPPTPQSFLYIAQQNFDLMKRRNSTKGKKQKTELVLGLKLSWEHVSVSAGYMWPFNRRVLPTRCCHLLPNFKTIFPWVKKVMVLFCIGLWCVRWLKIVTVIDMNGRGSNENNEEWVDCYYW